MNIDIMQDKHAHINCCDEDTNKLHLYIYHSPAIGTLVKGRATHKKNCPVARKCIIVTIIVERGASLITS